MAEETILLSNQDYKNVSPRQIAIKNISDIQLKKQVEDTEARQQEKVAATALKRSNLKQEIADLKQQKNVALEELRQSIQQEKDAWSKEKEVERKQVQDKGYKDGYDAGLKEAKVAWQDRLNKVNELTEQAKQDYYKTIDKHEETIIQLAIATAEKIIHHEIQVDNSFIANIIGEAINELKNEAYIHIYCHPEAYELVVMQKPELEQIVGTKDLISIYVDPELKKTDCVIKHPNGQIDVSIDSQLRQVKNALFEKVMEES